MNIAVFIKKTTFHEKFGGLETQNRTLCEGLVNRGHKVTVFSPKLSLTKSNEELNGVSYKFVECSFRSLAGFDYLDKNNWVNRSVDEFKKAYIDVPFTLVLAQSSAGLGIIKRKKEFDIPVISISHGTTVGEYRTLLMSIKGFKDVFKLIPNTAYFLLNYFKRQREFVLKSDRVVAVSKVVKTALKEETFVPSEKVTVVYNGVSRDGGNVEKKPSKKVTLLYVGLISWSKGLSDLLKAFEKLDVEKVRLVIAGEGEHLKDLRDTVEKKGLGNSVEILGKIPYDEVYPLMQKADIFILPSRRVEGFPMTIPEAMFAGLPVVGSNMGGIPEAIEDTKTGLIFKSRDIEGLFNALNTLIEDEGLRDEMGKRALHKARQEFTLDVMLNKYEKIIEEVIT